MYIKGFGGRAMKIIKLDKPEDIRSHASSMLAIIGEQELKLKGEYKCLVVGKMIMFMIKQGAL